jgi:hypothetical protein
VKTSGPIDLALGLLDHQLVDSENRRCGKVDDLEIEGIGGGEPRLAAIVVGPPGWRGRGRIGRLASRLARARATTVPWSEVAEIGSAVGLRKPAAQLRLGRGDDRARRYVARVPGADR